MTRYYIPYNGKNPVSFEVNGHRLIPLSTDKDAAEAYLESIGGTRIRTVKVDSENAEQKFFTDFSQNNGAGVVVMPAEVPYHELLLSLEMQLPWVH